VKDADPNELVVVRTGEKYVGKQHADARDMYTVHTMFRREFGLLPGLVRTVAAEDTERARVVTQHIQLMNFLVEGHHSAEDAFLWPKVLERAPREIVPVVHLVEGHHKDIDALIGEIGPLLGPWSDTAGSDDGEALARLLERLAVALYEHMALEEKLVLPLVEQHVLAVEWEEMVNDVGAKIPQGIGLLLVGMLMYEGGPDAAPLELRSVLAEMGPPAYAAHSGLVHGTPTPARSTDIVIGRSSVGVARP
jgi:hemerythrin-like domain-containing protein